MFHLLKESNQLNQNMKNKIKDNVERTLIVGLVLLAWIALMVVISLVGCGTTPNVVDKALFTESTNFVTKIVTVTNVVPVFTTITNTITNTDHTVVQVPMPAYITTYLTNVVTETNVVPQIQLSPGMGSNLATGVAGSIGGMFGVGGLVTTVLGGLCSAYLGFRNRQMSGDNSAITQTAGVLTQNIETLMEVLNKTPQGQAIMPMLKNYLVQHQSEAGVVQQVGALVEQFVQNPAAKASADEILNAVKTIQGSPVKA